MLSSLKKLLTAQLLLLFAKDVCFVFKDENFYQAVHKLDYLDAVLNESLRMYPPAWQYDGFIIVAFTVMSPSDEI